MPLERDIICYTKAQDRFIGETIYRYVYIIHEYPIRSVRDTEVYHFTKIYTDICNNRYTYTRTIYYYHHYY